MSAYTTLPQSGQEDINIADPRPLGFGLIALSTALLGCYFADFIIPSASPLVRTGIGVIQTILGLVLLFVGMWEFRRNNTTMATIFTLYGGFLTALGLLLTPIFGLWGDLNSSPFMHMVIGLLLLGWVITLAILLVAMFMMGGIKRYPLEFATLSLLFLSYLFLMFGELAGGSIPVLRIGGWLAILTSLVSWLVTLMYIMRLVKGSEPSAERSSVSS